MNERWTVNTKFKPGELLIVNENSLFSTALDRIDFADHFHYLSDPRDRIGLVIDVLPASAPMSYLYRVVINGQIGLIHQDLASKIKPK